MISPDYFVSETYIEAAFMLKDFPFLKNPQDDS